MCTPEVALPGMRYPDGSSVEQWILRDLSEEKTCLSGVWKANQRDFV
jgi:hypothetical protein